MEVAPRLRHRPQAADSDSQDVADPDEETPPEESPRRRKGNPRCKRFLASPCFKGIIFVIVAAVPVFGIVVTLPKLLELRKCTSFFCLSRHWLLSLWLAVQFLYNFLMSQWTDPGGSMKHKPPYETTGQFELNITSETADAKPQDAEDEMHILFAPNFCEHCQHWKPPRSHHCSICNRCVLRMDHHCPFTGNCIGMRNHGHFFLMYVFAIIGLIYCLSLCISVIMTVPGGSGGFISNAGLGKKLPLFSPGIAGFITYLAMQILLVAGLEVGVLVVAATIAFIAVLSFGLPAMWMVCSGMTIIESQFPMKEYVQIKPQVYCPLGPGFYQRGRMENLLVVLGPRWWLRLLLPTCGGVIDVSPGLSPIPGKSGLDALKGRIAQVEKEGVQNSVTSCKQLGFNPGPSTVQKSGDV